MARTIIQEENEMTNQTIIAINTFNDFAEKYPTVNLVTEGTEDLSVHGAAGN